MNQVPYPKGPENMVDEHLQLMALPSTGFDKKPCVMLWTVWVSCKQGQGSFCIQDALDYAWLENRDRP